MGVVVVYSGIYYFLYNTNVSLNILRRLIVYFLLLTYYNMDENLRKTLGVLCDERIPMKLLGKF